MQYEKGRIALREFGEKDFDLLYSVLSNEKIMRYAYWERFESKDAMMPVFQKVLENNQTAEGRKAYEYAVYLKSGEYIGYAGVEINKQNDYGGYGEIGYFLLEDYWGKGLATEMAEAVLEICFTQLNLHKATASCNADNISSENIMKKIGMKKEGCFRKERFKNGMWHDELRYGILKEEWEK
jgi:ribosomal-protein-alanine N-acetyltransferase